jgi:hypothetical protein
MEKALTTIPSIGKLHLTIRFRSDLVAALAKSMLT